MHLLSVAVGYPEKVREQCRSDEHKRMTKLSVQDVQNVSDALSVR